MQLGIFAKTFARGSVEEVFDAVAAHGLHCVQFNFASAGLPSLPDELEFGVLERIRGAAAARRISMAAISGTCNLIHPDPQQRSEGLQRLRVIISACTYLGVQIVTLCTGTRDADDMWHAHPENASPESWRDLTSSIEEALEVADLNMITLGIEPEINNIIDSARSARRLLDEIKSPNLKVILDAANLIHPDEFPRRNEIIEDAVSLLGEDIILAHAKELGRDGHTGGLPLGAGALDWDHYLSLLQLANFNGPLIMHGFQEHEVAASAAFLLQKDAVGARNA